MQATEGPRGDGVEECVAAALVSDRLRCRCTSGYRLLLVKTLTSTSNDQERYRNGINISAAPTGLAF